MKYSKKIIKEVNTMTASEVRHVHGNHFEIVYNVSYLHDKWHCTCFNAQFGPSQKRYCKHILAVMKFHKPKDYEEAIKEE